MKQNIEIVRCDFSNPIHCQAEIDLMHAYMTDEMGGAMPLDDNQNRLLIDGLNDMPNALVLLAKINNTYVGLTNSFINFGTFAVKKFINIHDLIVLKEFRNQGIGERLLEENIRLARQMGCAKVTLEVREDNAKASRLYKKMGFDDCKPRMFYWTKHLE